MKLIVAYDGSKCAEAALDDLTNAGLPHKGSVLVMCVAEVWLPPKNGSGVPSWELTGINLDPDSLAMIQRHYERNEKAVAEAATLANHAKQRVKGMFPDWQVDSEATYGSPAWEILARADELKPELIVVGSHGRSAVGRVFLGSISQKVLTEANCSVRVARGRIEVDPTTARVLIGFDGSAGAQAAVDSVCSRDWKEGSKFELVAAVEDVTPSLIGRFIPPATQAAAEINETERRWIEKLADAALARMSSCGLPATLEILAGSPKTVLVEEAERWNADSIFVGANAFGSRVERFLLGSTSAAVAARAHCSVEVVRKRT